MKDMKNIRKSMIKTVAIAAMVTMAALPLTAQVFLQKDKGDIAPRTNQSGTSTGKEWIIVPVQGLDIDQYAMTPVGSGALLLAGMAGAYAFAKRRKRG